MGYSQDCRVAKQTNKNPFLRLIHTHSCCLLEKGSELEVIPHLKNDKFFPIFASLIALLVKNLPAVQETLV